MICGTEQVQKCEFTLREKEEKEDVGYTVHPVEKEKGNLGI